ATAGGIIDIWQRPVTDIGQTGPDKGNGGKYLILPPGAPDEKAPGYFVAHSKSVQVWVATRGLGSDPEAAGEVLRKHRLYAWKDRANPGTTQYIPVGGKAWTSNQPANLDYWRYLAEVFAPETPEPRDRFFFAMLQPLGIEKGKPFSPDE